MKIQRHPGRVGANEGRGWGYTTVSEAIVHIASKPPARTGEFLSWLSGNEPD